MWEKMAIGERSRGDKKIFVGGKKRGKVKRKRGGDKMRYN